MTDAGDEPLEFFIGRDCRERRSLSRAAIRLDVSFNATVSAATFGRALNRQVLHASPRIHPPSPCPSSFRCSGGVAQYFACSRCAAAAAYRRALARGRRRRYVCARDLGTARQAARPEDPDRQYRRKLGPGRDTNVGAHPTGRIHRAPGERHIRRHRGLAASRHRVCTRVFRAGNLGGMHAARRVHPSSLRPQDPGRLRGQSQGKAWRAQRRHTGNCKFAASHQRTTVARCRECHSSVYSLSWRRTAYPGPVRRQHRRRCRHLCRGGPTGRRRTVDRARRHDR